MLKYLKVSGTDSWDNQRGRGGERLTGKGWHKLAGIFAKQELILPSDSPWEGPRMANLKRSFSLRIPSGKLSPVLDVRVIFMPVNIASFLCGEMAWKVPLWKSQENC